MTPKSTTPDRFGFYFLRLPRELRDLIYAEVERDFPIDITNTDIHVAVEHPIIQAEWLEAIVKHSIFNIDLSDPQELQNRTVQRCIWGTRGPLYESFMRRLVVNATEASLPQTSLEETEHECTTGSPWHRQEWNELLRLSQLEELTINLQKSQRKTFAWANFSPVVIQLREQLPKLRITLNVSFDTILEEAWNRDIEALYPDGGRYQPMGFVDMSNLIAEPTDGDRRYVEEHLPLTRDLGERDCVNSLLYEFPRSRRVLAPFYMVKDTPLLAVLMQEHYEIYKRVRGSTARGDEVSG
jgi:hypothetical protein